MNNAKQAAIDIHAPIKLLTFVCIARNAEQTLPDLLEDVLRQEYPASKTEVILVDSNSSDKTRAIMERFKQSPRTKAFENIIVTTNPKISLPAGMNIAIQKSSGDAIVRLDAHARIPSDFFKQSVTVLEEGHAVCGGRRYSISAKGTKWQQVLTCADSSSFGALISVQTRRGKTRRVRSVYHACFRKEIFELVGLYNEDLWRTEEADMSYRIKQAGYSYYFDTRIVTYQISRPTLISMMQQRQANGFWAVRTLFIEPLAIPFSAIFPAIFVASVVIALVYSLITQNFVPIALVVGIYLTICIIMSVITIQKTKRRNALMIMLPLIFPLLHFSYGLGNWQGFVVGLIDKFVSNDAQKEKD